MHAQRGIVLAAVATALVAVGTFNPAFAIDIGFTLVNDASQEVTDLRLAAPASEEWGDNALNTGTLPSGATEDVMVFNAPGCVMDVKISYELGAVVEDRAVDFCKLADGIYAVSD